MVGLDWPNHDGAGKSDAGYARGFSSQPEATPTRTTEAPQVGVNIVELLSMRSFRRQRKSRVATVSVAIAVLVAVGPPSTLWAGSTQGASFTMPMNSLGLVGWWTFDGNTMQQNVGDSSGSDNSGYIVAAATSTQVAAGPIGQALKFNGTNQYVRIPSSYSINLPNTLTLSAWVKFPSLGTGGVISKQGVNFQYYLDVDWSSGAFDFSLANSAGNSHTLLSYTNNGAFIWSYANKWTLITATYDGTTMSMYVNGVLVKQQAYASPIYTGADNLYIGSINTTSNFSGTIDDARIYNRALSAAEIQRLYQQGTGSHMGSSLNPGTLGQGLVGWWTFDGNNMIRNVADSSGTGNNGTITNGTSTSAGAIGQAESFNGSNQSILFLSNSAYDTPAGSWSFWIKSAGIWGTSSGTDSQHRAALMDRDDITGDANGIIVHLSQTGTIHAVASNGSGPVVNLSANGLTDNKWHLVTFVFGQSSGAIDALYIDAVQAASGANSASWSFSSQGVLLGRQNSSFWDFFGGSLDDVRIYNRALSATEVAQLYQFGIGSHQNVTVNPPNLNTGLVGHWSFDGPDMLKNVADTSGNGNTGYLTGFTSTTTAIGVIGQALSFDGSNKYVDVGRAVSLRVTNFSSAIWLRTSDTADAMPLLAPISCCGSPFMLVNSTGSGGAYQNGTIAYFNGGAWLTKALGAGNVGDGKWHLMVVTTGGTDNRIYWDGVQVAQLTAGADLADPNDLYIAGDGVHPTIHFRGTIDDVRLYNRALSAAEIQQLYKLGHY